MKRGAAAEADANRGAAALHMHRELSGAGLLTQANEGEVAERAKLLCNGDYCTQGVTENQPADVATLFNIVQYT